MPCGFSASACPPPQVIALSAKSAAALAQIVDRLHAHLVRMPDTELGDVAYTLISGREAMPERLIIVTTGLDDLTERLRSGLAALETGQAYRGSKQAGQRKIGLPQDTGRGRPLRAIPDRANQLDEMARHWVDGLDFELDRHRLRARPGEFRCRPTVRTDASLDRGAAAIRCAGGRRRPRGHGDAGQRAADEAQAQELLSA